MYVYVTSKAPYQSNQLSLCVWTAADIQSWPRYSNDHAFLLALCQTKLRTNVHRVVQHWQETVNYHNLDFATASPVRSGAPLRLAGRA